MGWRRRARIRVTATPRTMNDLCRAAGVRPVPRAWGGTRPRGLLESILRLVRSAGVALTAPALRRSEAPTSLSGDSITRPAGSARGITELGIGKPMRPDVAPAFDRMAAAARADGVDLLITSASAATPSPCSRGPPRPQVGRATGQVAAPARHRARRRPSERTRIARAQRPELCLLAPTTTRCKAGLPASVAGANWPAPRASVFGARAASPARSTCSRCRSAGRRAAFTPGRTMSPTASTCRRSSISWRLGGCTRRAASSPTGARSRRAHGPPRERMVCGNDVLTVTA
jgi:hypothetical protein